MAVTTLSLCGWYGYGQRLEGLSLEPRAGPLDFPVWVGSPQSLLQSPWMSGAQQVPPRHEVDPGFLFLEPGLGGIQESGCIFQPLSPL